MVDALYVEKVTAFVTNQRSELLLLQHPNAGIQIPAGTVELGEAPAAAVVREVAEETGLTAVSPPALIATSDEQIPANRRVIIERTAVYARSDTTSFDWAHLRRGINVIVRRQENGFTQVEYLENDREPDPQFVTYAILGWVPNERLAQMRRRYFFHINCNSPTPQRWTQFSDNHTFTLFWAPITNLPPIMPPQDQWLQHLQDASERNRT